MIPSEYLPTPENDLRTYHVKTPESLQTAYQYHGFSDNSLSVAFGAQMLKAVHQKTLTPDFGHALNVSKKRGTSAFCNEGEVVTMFYLPFPLAESFARLAGKCGLTFEQGVCFLMRWAVTAIPKMNLPDDVPTMDPGPAVVDDDDDDNEGEEWKRGEA